ncbi:SMC-Scp complex subunit ScpB [Mucilaginibacter sp. RS28]|uniref:SMC-Scp complex subunit ScpB n=1 Tax=Mucilaginibacter straminoryzae TaxID=2932774 RepID=A0A9X1X0I2_9SPHI|nr:SMC-Scp complex subunit ScpB [Mucilaginibacter straminoryzae]MCJ8208899.1 SMC-Scp complex subunit ScpB [Mucilaginibacter straminoryzae]
MENIVQNLEALIFASEQSIRLEELQYCLQSIFHEDISAEQVIKYLDDIKSKYADEQFAIELVRTGNGYQFLTKKKYHEAINQLQLQRSKKKLSQAAIETLAIVAYRQPITKLEVEQIRGVNCDYTIQKLLEKELIVISGKADSVGKPLLYSTSPLFMDYFGINNISELPQLKDLVNENDSIGEQKD